MGRDKNNRRTVILIPEEYGNRESLELVDELEELVRGCKTPVPSFFPPPKSVKLRLYLPFNLYDKLELIAGGKDSVMYLCLFLFHNKPKPKIKPKVSNDVSKDLKERYPRISRMKNPLTDKQYEALIEKYTNTVVFDVLEAMENHAKLHTKYVSASMTADNWCKRRENMQPDKGQVVQKKRKFL